LGGVHATPEFIAALPERTIEFGFINGHNGFFVEYRSASATKTELGQGQNGQREARILFKLSEKTAPAKPENALESFENEFQP
jgi:hypothetical protein